MVCFLYLLLFYQFFLTTTPQVEMPHINECRLTWIRHQQRRFDNNDADSTTITRIRQQRRGFDNNDTSRVGIGSNVAVSNPTRTYRTQCVLTAGDSMAVDSRMADLRVAGIDWREGNSELRFRWCVANSLHPFLFADHLPRTPSVNSPRVRSLRVELNATCP